VDQTVITHVAETLGALRWYDLAAEDELYRQKMKEYGLQIIVLSDTELQKCADKVQKNVWPEVEKLIGKDLMDLVLNTMGIKKPY
jgi:TRAP-type C4-dicarboxylate transport system substrate-binding protein